MCSFKVKLIARRADYLKTYIPKIKGIHTNIWGVQTYVKVRRIFRWDIELVDVRWHVELMGLRRDIESLSTCHFRWHDTHTYTYISSPSQHIESFSTCHFRWHDTHTYTYISSPSQHIESFSTCHFRWHFEKDVCVEDISRRTCARDLTACALCYCQETKTVKKTFFSWIVT